jgi:uncharacterized protein (TIRG00374 family)
MTKLYHYFQAKFGQRKLRRIFTNFLTLAVIIALGVYLYQNQEILVKIKEFNGTDVFIIFMLQVINLFVLGLFNMVMYKRIEPRVTFSDSIFLQYVNNFFNNILFRGGGIYRAIYLKTQYQFPYARFVSAVAGLYVITFLTNSLFGLLSVINISNKYGENEFIVMLIFLGVFLGSLVIVFLNPKINKSQDRLVRMINSVIVGWKTIKKDKPKDILYLIFLSCLNLILNSGKFFYIYKTMGTDMRWVEVVYLATLAVIMQVINITPSGLGIQETVFALSSSVILISDETLVLGSLINRAIAIPGSALLGLVSYGVLQRRLKEKAVQLSKIIKQEMVHNSDKHEAIN